MKIILRTIRTQLKLIPQFQKEIKEIWGKMGMRNTQNESLFTAQNFVGDLALRGP